MPSLLKELQSDAEFAEVFARSKWRQSKWAPSRIRTVCVMLLVMLLASARAYVSSPCKTYYICEGFSRHSILVSELRSSSCRAIRLRSEPCLG